MGGTVLREQEKGGEATLVPKEGLSHGSEVYAVTLKAKGQQATLK